jgi:hypothetical protein
MQKVTQLNVTVQNSPNSLAKIGDKLRSANINIDAISVSEGTQNSIIHLIVDDPDTAKIVLQEVAHVEAQTILGVRMKNTPGAIASIGRSFAIATINIKNIYATTLGKEAMVYVVVDDVEEAMEKMRL